jgi:hypothetical protein
VIWKQEFAKKQKSYERSLEELGELDLRRAQAKLRTLQARLDGLEEKKKKHDALVLQIQDNYQKRAELSAAMNEARTERYNKRVAKASSWENLFRGKIKVQISQSSDRSEYLETLKGIARGAKLRELDLRILTDRFHPSALSF